MAEAAQAIEAAAEPEPAAEQLGSPPTSASPSHPTPSGGRKVRIRIFLGANVAHMRLSSGPDSLACWQVLAAEIAEPFRAEIRETIAQRYGDAPPKLVGLLGNDVRPAPFSIIGLAILGLIATAALGRVELMAGLSF